MTDKKKKDEYKDLRLTNGRVLSWIHRITKDGKTIYYAEVFGCKRTRVCAYDRDVAINGTISKTMGIK